VDPSENKLVVQRFMELVDHGGDLNQLEVLCTPDHINHALAPGRPNGIEGTREFLSSPGRRAHAGRWVDLVTVAEADYVVEYGVRAGSWPAGPFRGFDVPGGAYERDVAFMYRLEDGRIAERWAVRDDLGLMLQLGGLTSPSPTNR
jgi:predicted ester cyclase